MNILDIEPDDSMDEYVSKKQLLEALLNVEDAEYATWPTSSVIDIILSLKPIDITSYVSIDHMEDFLDFHDRCLSISIKKRFELEDTVRDLEQTIAYYETLLDISDEE